MFPGLDTVWQYHAGSAQILTAPAEELDGLHDLSLDTYI